MNERFRVVRQVACEPRLLRIELAFFGFNMAEFGTWVAILVYAYDRDGASAASVVAAIQLVPSGLLRSGRSREIGSDATACCSSAMWPRWSRSALVAVSLFADAPFSLSLGVATVAAASLTFTRPTQAAFLAERFREPRGAHRGERRLLLCGGCGGLPDEPGD
jgi:hypothetical protein